jgi:hypothetical protein
VALVDAHLGPVPRQGAGEEHLGAHLAPLELELRGRLADGGQLEVDASSVRRAPSVEA